MYAIVNFLIGSIIMFGIASYFKKPKTVNKTVRKKNRVLTCFNCKTRNNLQYDGLPPLCYKCNTTMAFISECKYCKYSFWSKNKKDICKKCNKKQTVCSYCKINKLKNPYVYTCDNCELYKCHDCTGTIHAPKRNVKFLNNESYHTYCYDKILCSYCKVNKVKSTYAFTCNNCELYECYHCIQKILAPKQNVKFLDNKSYHIQCYDKILKMNNNNEIVPGYEVHVTYKEYSYIGDEYEYEVEYYSDYNEWFHKCSYVGHKINDDQYSISYTTCVYPLYKSFIMDDIEEFCNENENVDLNLNDWSLYYDLYNEKTDDKHDVGCPYADKCEMVAIKIKS